MSMEVDQFMSQLGISESDFEVTQQDIYGLGNNEEYIRSLWPISSYLGRIANDSGVNYHEVDNFDSDEKGMLRAYIASFDHFLKDTGQNATKPDLTRVIVTTNNMLQGVNQELTTDSFVLNLNALEQGILWDEQTIQPKLSSNGSFVWASKRSYLPIIVRQNNGKDSRRGPASIKLIMGSESERELCLYAEEGMARDIAAAERLTTCLKPFLTVGVEIPVESTERVWSTIK